MNWIEFLFRLLNKYSHWEPDEYAKTREEAAVWWSKVRTDEKALAGEKGLKQWLIKYKKFEAEWYVKVFWSILYVIMVFVIRRAILAQQDLEDAETKGW